MPRSRGPHVDDERRVSRLPPRRGAFRRFVVAPPRGVGHGLAAAFFLSVALYGSSLGRPYNPTLAALGTPGDMIANLCGFRIEMVTIKGQEALTDNEILTAAGVTDTSSLLLMDADAARAGLEQMPLVASATVHKLYPNTLAITIEERKPFALWQRDGRVHLIAEDGKVIQEISDDRFAALPFVVGEGGELRAEEIVKALSAVPEVRKRVRAAVLVAKRRWNLMLDNDVVVRLPEGDLDAALLSLANLQSEGAVFDKAVLAIDLRLPDRVAFRLTADAAEERAKMLAEAAKKRKKGAST
ncbi:MAG: cell division protein FtsQ/DivIB [Labrys sp. (in: a-proteobacteria)]